MSRVLSRAEQNSGISTGSMTVSANALIHAFLDLVGEVVGRSAKLLAYQSQRCLGGWSDPIFSTDPAPYRAYLRR